MSQEEYTYSIVSTIKILQSKEKAIELLVIINIFQGVSVIEP